MRKITIEILEIIIGTIFLAGGLALILTWLDGRMVIGFVMIIIGSLIWTHLLRAVTVSKGKHEQY